MLDFEDNYESTASHFALIRRAVADPRVKIGNLAFQKLKRISPSAALVLASEVDIWNTNSPRRLRANVDSWHPDIARLLSQMGYFELLGIDGGQCTRSPHGTNFLPFVRGIVKDRNDSARLAKQLRIDIEELTQEKIARLHLFSGLSEAITNAVHHAYSNATLPSRKLWWMSASYDAGDRQLHVTFYDHGRGIPATLPFIWKHFEKIRHFYHQYSDSERIKAAMELGRTSTEIDGRGQGLQDMLSFSRAYTEGSLTIFSLRGQYCDIFPSNAYLPTPQDHANSIGGTLIEWSVKI